MTARRTATLRLATMFSDAMGCTRIEAYERLVPNLPLRDQFDERSQIPTGSHVVDAGRVLVSR